MENKKKKEVVKLGWNRLDEETKDRLKKVRDKRIRQNAGEVNYRKGTYRRVSFGIRNCIWEAEDDRRAGGKSNGV